MDKKKLRLLLLALGFALLLTAGVLVYPRLSAQWAPDNLQVQTTEATTAPTESTETEPAETDPTEQTEYTLLAPDFTVYDREGNPAKLSDYFGKPIVLNFWASWCGSCQSEMPTFQEKYAQLGDRVHFLMVNVTSGRETLESAKDFLDRTGYTFPALFDATGEAAYIYNVYYLPTTYFIDAQGYLVARATSALDEQLLQKGLDMIMGENTDGETMSE